MARGSRKPIELVFPFGGLNKGAGYQRQPPYTTAACKNVCPRDTEEGRLRGGSRPGLQKAFQQQLATTTTTGTMSGAAVVGTSSVQTTTAVLNAQMVAGTVTFATSSNSYTIAQYISGTRLILTGDASGEASGDTLSISYSGRTVAATADGTPAVNTSTVTATTDKFLGQHVGGTITFDTSSNSYTISAYSSPTVITVIGDATGETSGDTFVITYGVPVNLLGQVREINSSPAGGRFWEHNFALYAEYDVHTRVPIPDPPWTLASWCDELPYSVANRGVGVYTLTPSQTTGAVRANDLDLTATVTGTIDSTSGTGPTTINATTEVFTAAMENGRFVGGSGTSYNIITYTDTDTIIVEGNASGESGAFSVIYTGAYTITLDVPDPQPWGNYCIYARMNNNTPLISADGCVLKVFFLHEARDLFSIQLNFYKDSGLEYQYAVSNEHMYEYFANGFKISLKVDEASDRGVTYTILTPTKSWTHTVDKTDGVPFAKGERFGFGLEAPSGLDGRGIATTSAFRIQYTPPTAQVVRTRIVAAAFTVAAKDLFLENNTGALVDLGAGKAQPILNRMVQTVERLGLLYYPTDAPDPTGGVSSYDPVNDTYTGNVATATQVGCKAIAVYRDRIVVGGQESNPHVWYMSTQGDPTDWDDTAGGVEANINTQTAVHGTSSGVDTGRMGAPITALMPSSDDYLIMGGLDVVYRLIGDPRRGGQLDLLSSRTGILGPMAWCGLPDGANMFLGRKGLYYLRAGGMNYPEPVSEGPLPRELRDIDTVNYEPILGYDPTRNWVLVAITPRMGEDGFYYVFDVESATFWPLEFPVEQQPLTLLTYDADVPTQRALLFGCRDGYVRRFVSSAAMDEGTEIDSEVLYGPIKLGVNDLRGGAVVELVAALGEDSGDVEWELLVGDSAEEAKNATALASGRWSAGRNPSVRPDAGGHTAYLRLSNAGREAWHVEYITAVLERHGRYMEL